VWSLTRKGGVAIVTGGARGIGRVTARLLAESGADVGVVDLTEAAETLADIRRIGRRGEAVVADVSNADAAARAVRTIAASLGDPLTLVSAAAITTNIAPVSAMPPEAWERELAVNLTGAFNMVRAVLPGMLGAGWGRVVLVSSVAATRGLGLQGAYAASKAGLVALAKTLALENARHGVTANAILPGLIGSEAVIAMPSEILDAAMRRIPARRLGAMEEIGWLASFLASDQAAYINGAELVVDGGLSLSTVTLGSRREAVGAEETRRTD
jgi:3-oxoacyl-[acyl-carrier protein] reductase